MRRAALPVLFLLVVAGCVTAGPNETPAGKLWRQYGVAIEAASAIRVETLKSAKALHDAELLSDSSLERFRDAGDKSHAMIEAAKDILSARVRGMKTEMDSIKSVTDYQEALFALLRLAAELGVEIRHDE